MPIKQKRLMDLKRYTEKKDNFISIGPINHNVTRNQIEEVIEECIKNKIINVDVLGFEYEMGLFPSIQEDAKIKGIKLSYKQIPNEIFNEKAVKSGQVKFFDVAYIEIKPHIKKKNYPLNLKILQFSTMKTIMRSKKN